jgi:hypothetical protein
MSEVAMTSGAENFDAEHSMATVLAFDDDPVADGGIKARPARS